jgi:hypothetical protein
MKSNKFLIASLLILVAMGAITVSCKKEKVAFCKAELIFNDNCAKTGDDDDDPIVHGRVKKKQGLMPIDSAYVETMAYGTNLRVGTKYTDNLGEFDQQVDTGTYYFKITIPGFSTPYYTDTFFVTRNRDITILID